MKKAFAIVILVGFMILTTNAWAQLPSKGFFVGGSVTGLMMKDNGKQEVEDIVDKADLDVTDPLIEWDIEEYTGYFTLEYGKNYPGWGWGNKYLYGFKPVVGYKINPKFAVMASYNYYMKKKGETHLSYTAPAGYDGLVLTYESDMEYSQKAIQILGQFYPITGKGLFLLAGYEFVSMSAERTELFSLKDNAGEDVWWDVTWEGSASTSGLVFGAGFEHPISSSMTLIGTALYSLTKYSGDELLKGKGDTDDMDWELDGFGVGGFSINAGIRMYFGTKSNGGGGEKDFF